jgi:hypothetical protein
VMLASPERDPMGAKTPGAKIITIEIAES